MDYKVSVIFITYNHEKYVEKALRSVLNQETDFPFEVVVGEDCSTDNTAEKLRKIAAEYPEHEPTGNNDRQVRLYLREENTGGRPTLNVYETTKRCQGEYLAYLEGDDYWTDTHKLQKQIDFLSNHPEYIAVTHDMDMVDEESNLITDPDTLRIGDLYKHPEGVIDFEDYKATNRFAGHYATVVSRNIYLNDRFDYTILYRASDFTDDAVILLFLLMQGDIYRMPDKMSAWRYVRKQGAGNWNSLMIDKNLMMDNAYLARNLIKWIENYIPLGEYSYKRCYDDFGLALKWYLKKPNKENKKFLADMYEYGVRHVLCKEKKTSLLTYSIAYIWGKITKKVNSYER